MRGPPFRNVETSRIHHRILPKDLSNGRPGLMRNAHPIAVLFKPHRHTDGILLKDTAHMQRFCEHYATVNAGKETTIEVATACIISLVESSDAEAEQMGAAAVFRMHMHIMLSTDTRTEVALFRLVVGAVEKARTTRGYTDAGGADKEP